LKRKDIKSFGITKRLINDFLKGSKNISETKHGEYAVVERLSDRHDLRIIYDIIGKNKKVITFHISRRGRY
jgi:hypothetical protein